jgi:hypothetical protein
MKFSPLLLILFLGTACNRGPSTALARAAVEGDVEAVKRLAIPAGKQEIQDALIAASRAGAPAAIPALVAAGADPNGRSGVNHWSPLQHAIHKNQLASVPALVTAGAEINARDTHSRTALMMASGYGQTNIVKALLERGADPKVQDQDGLTALDFAISGVTDIDDFTLGQCKPDVVKALLDRAPELARSEKSWHAVATAVGKCGEVRTLLEQRRVALQKGPAGRS